MKKALISPNEKKFDGYRVCQVVDVGMDFPIAEPLFWTDCDDNLIADLVWYDPKTSSFVNIVLE